MALERRCELAAGFTQRVGLQVTFGGNGSYTFIFIYPLVYTRFFGCKFAFAAVS